VARVPFPVGPFWDRRAAAPRGPPLARDAPPCGAVARALWDSPLQLPLASLKLEAGRRVWMRTRGLRLAAKRVRVRVRVRVRLYCGTHSATDTRNACSRLTRRRWGVLCVLRLGRTLMAPLAWRFSGPQSFAESATPKLTA
jgi:hypothetical protein